MLDIIKLPISADNICTEDALEKLQKLTNLQCNDDKELEHLLLYIHAVIDKELTNAMANAGMLQYNQVLLNVAFRTYFNLLRKHKRKDETYTALLEKQTAWDVRYFLMLYCILLTGNKFCGLSLTSISERCMESLHAAIDNNQLHVLLILKTINLCNKKHENWQVKASLLKLDHVYYCLQSQQIGMREEMLTFLTGLCAKDKQLALRFFQHVIHYWPWTNRNKLYVLSSILKWHALENFLQNSQELELFFKGLRLTLAYKYLLAASQYMIKALSGQSSSDLLQLSADILQNGSQAELQNFYDHWFFRIDDKQQLFDILKEVKALSPLFQKCLAEQIKLNYRLVLIFCMFSKYFHEMSSDMFQNFSQNLLSNCFGLEQLETQLLVFNFCVENINMLQLNVSLKFIVLFLEHHQTVESSQFRNTVLSKLIITINYIAKVFHRLPLVCISLQEQAYSDKEAILNFFQALHNLILTGLANFGQYQPLILALKILELLLKSLYAKNPEKNAKNCAVKENQELGDFLQAAKLFDKLVTFESLLQLLGDQMGFDDAQDLAANLLKLLHDEENSQLHIAEVLSLCNSSCNHAQVDNTKLSFLYAKVFIQSCQNNAELLEFYDSHWLLLNDKLQSWLKDPLWSCHAGQGHLFGHLDVLHEIMQLKPELLSEVKLLEILKFIEQLEDELLKMLNTAANAPNGCTELAASFQDIDESLQLLVQQSNWKSDNHEQARKYLLMSFWLTLRGCTALAATMGTLIINLGSTANNTKPFLQRCLQACSMVLTRCRHKGAIEFAGLCIGKLSQSISKHFAAESEQCGLLHSCLYRLIDFGETSAVSTTRRGAGFSIMFLHLIKNEAKPTRPLLKEALEILIKKLKSSTANNCKTSNCDRFDALALHYLCVLARDTVLREAMQAYYSEILMIAVKQIDNPEWTVCNGALQLFGALIPKIVGQRRQSMETAEQAIDWEPCEITLSEILRQLPKICEYILQYCAAATASTKSIILFLGFLQKVEHLEKETDAVCFATIMRFRQLMWSLLRHPCEKVRKLSAVCFVRFHEYRCDLPIALVHITQILFKTNNENFFEGLIFALEQGILKLHHESLHTMQLECLFKELKNNLEAHFHLNHSFKLYSVFRLKKLLQQLNFSANCQIMQQLACYQAISNSFEHQIGQDLWLLQ